MPNITHEHIKKIAELAQLHIPDHDPKLEQELNKILDLMKSINLIDTQTTLPLSHPYPEEQRLREDIMTESNQQEVLQPLAAVTQAGLYLVPPVIDSHS